MSSPSEKFRTSLIWEFGRTAYGQLIRFILSLVLARLLDPSDFGLISISYVLIRLAQVFSDVGFSSALIQSDSLTKKSYSTVFWINVAAGVLVFVAIELGAYALAAFYDQAILVELIQVLAVIFLIDALCQVQATRLKKSMDFRTINQIIIVSETISGIAGVAAAMLGWGLWSLVLQAVVSSTLNLLLYWWWSDWRPQLQFDIAEARRLFGFGVYVFINQLIFRLATRIDVLVIGKSFSVTVLGFYNRADSLLSLIKKYSSSSLIKVVFPYFSILKRDPAALQKSYLKIVGLLYFVLFFLTGIFFLSGREIVHVLYGPKWQTAGDYFAVLSLGIFIYPVNSVMNNTLLSLGKSRLSLRVGIVAVVLRITSITLSVLLFQDFYVVLYSLVVISVVINIMYILVLRDYVPWRDQIREFMKYLILTAVLLVVAHQIKAMMSIPSSWISVIVVSAIFSAAYGGTQYLVNRDNVKGYVEIVLTELKRLKRRA